MIARLCKLTFLKTIQVGYPKCDCFLNRANQLAPKPFNRSHCSAKTVIQQEVKPVVYMHNVIESGTVNQELKLSTTHHVPSWLGW